MELGISEGRLLLSAALVYCVPLVGLLFGAAIFQTLFSTDLAAVIGALLGGGLAFIGVKRWAKRLGKISVMSLLSCKSRCLERCCKIDSYVLAQRACGAETVFTILLSFNTLFAT